MGLSNYYKIPKLGKKNRARYKTQKNPQVEKWEQPTTKESELGKKTSINPNPKKFQIWKKGATYKPPKNSELCKMSSKIPKSTSPLQNKDD